MTPREIDAHFRGAMRRLEREQRGRAWAVHQGEALARAAKLPSFEAFAGSGSQARAARATPASAEVAMAQQIMVARMWHSAVTRRAG